MEKSEYEKRFEPQSLLNLSKTTDQLLDPDRALREANRFMSPTNLYLKEIDMKENLRRTCLQIKHLEIAIYILCVLMLTFFCYLIFV